MNPYINNTHYKLDDETDYDLFLNNKPGSNHYIQNHSNYEQIFNQNQHHDRNGSALLYHEQPADQQHKHQLPSQQQQSHLYDQNSYNNNVQPPYQFQLQQQSYENPQSTHELYGIDNQFNQKNHILKPNNSKNEPNKFTSPPYNSEDQYQHQSKYFTMNDLPRPQAQRINTAPSYPSLIQSKNNDQQEQNHEVQKDDNNQLLFTQHSLYYQKQSIPKAKRGRPKKKPGFHLNLEGINKKPIHNRLISSSQSDSGADYWNRTPGNNKSFIPQRISFIPIDLQKDKKNYEKELELSNSYNQNHMIPSFNLTPSIEPPSERNGYFDLDNTPKSTIINSGGFFSPAINENSENAFSQTFDDYLKDLERDYHNMNDGKLSKTNNKVLDQSPSLQYRNNHDSVSQKQPQTLNEVFAPLLFETLESSQLDSTSTNDFVSPDDANHSYLSSNDEKNPQQLLRFNVPGDDEHEARLSLPNLRKSISNQSVNSAASNGSELAQYSTINIANNNQIKPTIVKKRVLKGAVCQICNKFISRDLTRHMRIHNEVGRFQCVYPKHMCNHKTQNFNRPYDYKKHLLHRHFMFDDPEGKSANKLTDKLPITGACSACGARFVASEWLDNHVLTKDEKKRCAYIDENFISIDNS